MNFWGLQSVGRKKQKIKNGVQSRGKFGEFCEFFCEFCEKFTEICKKFAKNSRKIMNFYKLFRLNFAKSRNDENKANCVNLLGNFWGIFVRKFTENCEFFGEFCQEFMDFQRNFQEFSSAKFQHQHKFYKFHHKFYNFYKKFYNFNQAKPLSNRNKFTLSKGVKYDF